MKTLNLSDKSFAMLMEVLELEQNNTQGDPDAEVWRAQLDELLAEICEN